jgi:ribosomal protein L16 Arg81 hydroxylase
MKFQDLFGTGGSAQGFIAEHYLRSPFSSTGTAQAFIGLADAGLVDRLVEEGACDLSLVRNGNLLHQARPALAEAQALRREGYSFVFRHAERHDPGMAELAAIWAEALHGLIDVHVYHTPGGFHSFGWHYDAEEVFILQVSGSKDYFLRANAGYGDPAFESLPLIARFRNESSPIISCHLAAGDWLYIPGGWWHVAKAPEDSLSISLGVLAATPMQLFEVMRQRLSSSPGWRQRLPPSGQANPLPDAELETSYRQVLAGLAAELSANFSDPGMIAAFRMERQRYAQSLRRGARQGAQPTLA